MWWCVVSLVVFVLSDWCRRLLVFFVKQKTAYEMRISDWSSDVCSSDLLAAAGACALGPPCGLQFRSAVSRSRSLQERERQLGPCRWRSFAGGDRKSVVWERVCQYV